MHFPSISSTFRHSQAIPGLSLQLSHDAKGRCSWPPALPQLQAMMFPSEPQGIMDGVWHTECNLFLAKLCKIEDGYGWVVLSHIMSYHVCHIWVSHMNYGQHMWLGQSWKVSGYPATRSSQCAQTAMAELQCPSAQSTSLDMERVKTGGDVPRLKISEDPLTGGVLRSLRSCSLEDCAHMSK